MLSQQRRVCVTSALADRLEAVQPSMPWLPTLQGNLSEFVKAKPEAKAYYELSAAITKFKFPDPGYLDGIKGKSQSIVRLTGASYAYPGAPKPQVRGTLLVKWRKWRWVMSRDSCPAMQLCHAVVPCTLQHSLAAGWDALVATFRGLGATCCLSGWLASGLA